MGDWQNFDNRTSIGRAMRLRREIQDFESRWPKRSERGETMPPFSWEQLERQLVDLAATDTQAEMARHLVSATRKMAAFKPPEMVLREILCMTWVLLDENFKLGPSEDSAETD